MKSKLIIICLVLLTLKANAKTCQVTLKITNKATMVLSVSYSIRDEKGIAKGVPIVIGTLEPNGSDNRTISIKPNYTLEINSCMTNDQFASSQQGVTIPKLKKYILPINLREPDFRKLDKNVAIKKVESTFTTLNEIDFGFKATDLNSALNTYFGSLMVILPPKNKGEKGKELFRLPPGTFSNKVELGDFKFNDNSIEQEVEVSKDIALNISGSFPMISKIFGEFTNLNYSLISWNMTGFGWVPKSEKAGFNYLTQINNLDAITKKNLLAILNDNPTAFLVYIDHLYAIKNLQSQCTESHKVKVKTDVNAASVLTSDGLFNFIKDEKNNQKYSYHVLDIDGIPIQAKEILLTQMVATAAVSPKLPATLVEKEITGFSFDIINSENTKDNPDKILISKGENLIIPTPFDLKSILLENNKSLKVDLKQ